MGLCTNRVLMGQPLLALFNSAKRTFGPCSVRLCVQRYAQRESGSSFNRSWHKPAVGSRAEHVRPAPSISDINLLHYSRALSRRRRTLKCDEHGVRFFLFQEKRRLACVPTKNENRETR